MDEQVNLPELAAMVRTKRGTRGLQTAAQEIGGVSASTLSRVERGQAPDLDTFARLCQWLDMPPGHFMRSAEQEAPKKGSAVPQSGPDYVAAHLRADRVLDPKTIEALTTMIRLAYQAAAQSKQR